MIITKNWLNEWIDLENKNINDITNALNSIGLEVDKVSKIKVPDNIVVGYVKEKIKHEDSDKLSICQVDVGNEVLQIVCGAKNVDKDQYVAVALIGAIMPNGLQIKQAKLRGIQSSGMLCSSSELSFPKINDGIMLLDDSIGKLELGKALNSYKVFNDYLIEIELTPNRGDCLSIHGIARDLSAFYDLELKKVENFKEQDNVIGIGRVLKLQSDVSNVNASFNYKAIRLDKAYDLNLLMKLRLSFEDKLSGIFINDLLSYSTYSTGVLLNAYDFKESLNNDKEIILNLKEEDDKIDVFYENKLLFISGIYQDDFKKIKTNESTFAIVQASYIDPLCVAKFKDDIKNKDEDILYRSFRGSETNLNLGIDFFLNILKQYDIYIYSGMQNVSNTKEQKLINLNISAINSIIGQEIDPNQIVKILKKLDFEILTSGEILHAKVPSYRSDVKNINDTSEEILRIIGINNIKSKKNDFKESNKINDTYKKYDYLLNLRTKASNNGYFESIHYVFDNKDELNDFGFKISNLDIINPINSQLNTLRNTLLNNLLNAASFNIKNSKKIIKLFESGAVFDENANEINKIAFLHTGYKEEPKISNKAKPSLINFYDFLLDIKNIIGNFELKKSNISFLSPYEQAYIYKDNKKIGFLGRVHIKFENKKDLLKTYVCEIDFDLLKDYTKKANIYSKFPGINRDLSLLIPKDYDYENIKKCINDLKINVLENFKIVDLYHDENLKDNYSLTINFSFKDFDKTLEDKDIAVYMEQILNKIKQDLGLDLR